MFYDKSQISSTELYSPDFLCSEKALRQTASWHFIMTDGKWSTTTLFDYKTDKILQNIVRLRGLIPLSILISDRLCYS